MSAAADTIRRACRAAAAVTVTIACPLAAGAAEPGGAPLAAPLIKLALGLVGVVAALLVFSRILPRLGGMSFVGDGRFKVLASLPVGQRERVVLMQVGQRQIVVGVAPGRVSALHVLDEPLEVEAAPASAAMPRFASEAWIGRVLGGRSR
ncbi:MAG: flagellar biosynthetic protein FliO [Gammaproteobacteria bacterium]|nr:flagellar biosynthetic protein FliO [Gammaproteobacteria bacterium]